MILSSDSKLLILQHTLQTELALHHQVVLCCDEIGEGKSLHLQFCLV